ncbi:CHAT domain-containing protein [Sphingomonas baiyangensis]|nr:CHAT domain-containing protein [Sphingomonas baiyangensis]
MQKRGLALRERAGASADSIGNSEIMISITALSLDKLEDAERFGLRAAASFERAGASLSQGAGMSQAAQAARRLGKLDEAVAHARAAVALAERATPAVPLATAIFRNTLADALLASGNYQEGLAIMRAAHDGIAAVRAEGHPQRTYPQMGLGYATAISGDAAGGMALYRPAFESVFRSVRLLEVAQSRATGAAGNLESFGQGLDVARRAGDREFGFRIAQVMVESDAGRAALATLARLSASDPATAEAIDKRRELLRRRLELDGERVTKALADPAAAQALDTQIAAVDAELAAVTATLDAAMPGFDSLLRPMPEALAEVQARLGEGEVLLVPMTTHQGLFTFAVTRSRAVFGHDPVSRHRVKALVRRVLDGVLPEGRVRAGEDASRDLVDAPLAASFDRAATRELARAMLTPDIAALVGEARLVSVAADPVLSAIPFSLLPTGDAADAPWLIEQVALRAVPSIAALGRSPDAASGVTGFAGIGDPSPRAIAADASSVAKGLAALPPLPGARAELAALAAAIGPRRAIVLTGDDATEARLRTPAVAKAGVVAFATHGLVAGDFDTLAEPALLLAPDAAVAGQAGDGLLTASEAATLDIAAEWVVLSACNSAAGDSLSAAGYAGLARGFLLAGARNVLAAHWPVRDDVSSRLTVATIAASRNGAAAPQALAQAIRALIAEQRRGGGGDDPALWAPFMVVSR